MTSGWKPASEARDDGPDSLREWRWRSYTEHLEDLGYDLDGGSEPDREAPAEPTRSPGSGSRGARRG